MAYFRGKIGINYNVCLKNFKILIKKILDERKLLGPGLVAAWLVVEKKYS